MAGKLAAFAAVGVGIGMSRGATAPGACGAAAEMGAATGVIGNVAAAWGFPQANANAVNRAAAIANGGDSMADFRD